MTKSLNGFQYTIALKNEIFCMFLELAYCLKLSPSILMVKTPQERVENLIIEHEVHPFTVDVNDTLQDLTTMGYFGKICLLAR